jgi:hypothetical protein
MFDLNTFFQASLIFTAEAKLPIQWGTIRPWATPKY